MISYYPSTIFFTSGMPYALHEAGIGLGMTVLVGVAWITDMSLVLLIAAAKATRCVCSYCLFIAYL